MNNYKNNLERSRELKLSNALVGEAEKNTPILFNKKMKKLVVKPLNHIYSDTGKTRHFTPAAQEWFNSIYSFNKNYVKSLPTADKHLMNLLKSYFNFNLNLKLYKTKQLATRYKRLSAKKIFVGKGELKHTSDKVIITFYVYNTEKFYLLKHIKQIHKSLYYPNKDLKKYINNDRKGKDIITYNRPFTLTEYLALPNHREEWYFSYVLHFVNKLNQYYSNINTWYETLTNLIEKNILNKNDKDLFFKKIENLYTFNYPNYKFYMDKCYFKYTKSLSKNIMLLKFNKMKFKSLFLEKLTRLIYNIYNKKIEFNIVNLKKMHLNSDIFTQAVSLKLRNRNNKLYRVLRSSLRNFTIQNVKKVIRLDKGNNNKYIVNKIRNNNINSMFTNYNVKDPLNNLLLEYFPWSENLRINLAKYSNIISHSISIDNFVLYNLKHRKMAGIKVEAKGRLTRRFTASRSVFKMRWKGGLKNVDSSFRGLSAIMLRGHVKSNVQYSILNSKNRNGAFGVKGWVSNK
jgi:Mitochondrial ribosomal protein (VAR1)